MSQALPKISCQNIAEQWVYNVLPCIKASYKRIRKHKTVAVNNGFSTPSLHTCMHT